jgi:acetyl/propionyl-CoA carboxylase alpha subunit
MAYDPMVAKVCTWGTDRAQAIQRMHRALDETAILGITTNIPLHHRVLAAPAFLEGRYDTGLLSTDLADAARRGESQSQAVLAAAAIARLEADTARSAQQNLSPGGQSGWAQQGRNQRLGG